ncbi:MAG: putative permease [Deltaproteobacteria bacterium]|nr:putative permease [Deltaproteobacteria bacterium]
MGPSESHLMIFAAEKYLALIALGFGVGAYGTLIGAGGGFVLMPLLLILYPEESPEILTSISLAVVFFNALSGSEAYGLMKRIDYRSGLMFAAATVPGAAIGAMNTSHVPRHLFDIIFSVLMVAAAVFLLFRPGAPKATSKPLSRSKYLITRHLVDAHDHQYDYSFNPLLGIGLSIFVGYASSFLGIGGGIIHVPVLGYFLHFPIHVATATSHFILAIMALTGTVVHILTGTFAHGVHRTIALAIGVAVGAQLGAQFSQRVRGAWIIRSLALALGLVGIRILMNVW